MQLTISVFLIIIIASLIIIVYNNFKRKKEESILIDNEFIIKQKKEELLYNSVKDKNTILSMEEEASNLLKIDVKEYRTCVSLYRSSKSLDSDYESITAERALRRKLENLKIPYIAFERTLNYDRN